MKIEAVILYCSNDLQFYKTCVTNLLKTGIKCNVVTYTHLFAGEKENQQIIEHSHKPFLRDPNYKTREIQWEPGKTSIYWEALGRYKGTQMVDRDCEYILYIDPDEIVDPIPFRKWLDTGKYKQYTGMKFRVHTYYIDPRYRLKMKAYNTVMCRADFARYLGLRIEARLQYFNNNNRISRWMAKLGINPDFYIYRGEPFIHHYTGVRTKQQMLTKVINWSHNADRPDWTEVIEKDFKIKGKRIANKKFEIVDNQFGIRLPSMYETLKWGRPAPACSQPHLEMFKNAIADFFYSRDKNIS